ncbi:MAG: ATP:cob(I)alamin adenosyltransferase [Archaeoglobaceae archaeon]|nr:ATP:cob(I)alamin adenosyltransferase [Archaeoglobaceae archaeon]MDW7989060.1 ATP:cob(I)alamin adenosyltransferase [Archaeoglobaceae archaeon]
MLKPFETSTLSGKVWKDSIIAETLGTVDEANSFIGLAKVFSKREEVKATLKEVQLILFRVCAEIAGNKNSSKDLEDLFSIIREFEEKVEIPSSFIILEKDETTSILSIARTVVRRAERRAVSLYRNGFVDEKIVEILNRISYLLYLLILYEGESFEEVKF